MADREKSRSWFCILNNPEDVFKGEPKDIAEQALAVWVDGRSVRSGAVAYCVSAKGLLHLHMVLEDVSQVHFTTVKNLYPKAHLEPTKGTKEQAEDYIKKKGKWTEKGEHVLYTARHGEIRGAQGQRKDFEIMRDMIDEGKTPTEIFRVDMRFRKYERMVKQEYYDKVIRDMPFQREVKVYYHVGESRTGKSYESKKIVDTQGQEAIYMYSDYERGGLDNYNGQPILFMDEFRGQLQYAILLRMLDGYKMEMPARYSNIMPCWTEVHITSVLPPEMLYQRMVKEHQEIDSINQFLKRLHKVVYHYKKDNKYCRFELDADEYENYDELRRIALYGSQASFELPF